jgi:hypothetical protein
MQSGYGGLCFPLSHSFTPTILGAFDTSVTWHDSNMVLLSRSLYLVGHLRPHNQFQDNVECVRAGLGPECEEKWSPFWLGQRVGENSGHSEQNS